MNEINKNALRIIKFIIRSQQILPKVYMKKVQIYEKQLELINIDSDEWDEVIQILTFHKLISHVTKEDIYRYYEKIFEELIKKPAEKQLKEGKITEQQLEEIFENGAKSFGYDTSKNNIGDAENFSLFSEEERNEIRTDNQKEKIVKTDIIGRIEILQDLLPLKRKLEEGFDIENLGKSNLIYKEKEYELIIGTHRIKIKVTRRIPKHHQLLQYLFEQELGEEHKFTSILKSRFMEDLGEVERPEQIKFYAQGLNKKILKQTNEKIKNFLIISKEHIQINPEYLNES